ncbi:MAG: DUF3221 domain-containing protein [Clostridium sp.]
MKISKNLIALVFIAAVVITIGLSFMKTSSNYSFKGSVISKNSNSITVEPEKGSKERQVSDIIEVNITGLTVIQNEQKINAKLELIEAGDNVKVTYNGDIQESYPATITNTYGIQKLLNLQK